MSIPKDYCRYAGKKCMELRINFPFATCKKTGRKKTANGIEKRICVMEGVSDNVHKPCWCGKK